MVVELITFTLHTRITRVWSQEGFSYFTNTNLPKRSGLCGFGRSRPESDHRLNRLLGSVPSQRLRFAVQNDPGSGGSFFASSSKFAQGIATSRLQPLSLSPVWFRVPRMFVASCFLFFFNDTATTEIYTLSLHDALPISQGERWQGIQRVGQELSDEALG